MDSTARMPDLVRISRGLRHTVDSALATLARLGLADRVFLEAAGPGGPPGSIVGQEPAAGTPLDERGVTLRVAGPGGALHLPFAVRSRTRPGHSGEAGAGLPPPPLEADRLLALFDDQVLRLASFVRRAGGYLRLDAARPEPARRWVEGVFQLPAGPWTPPQLQRLAGFLPRLHRRAGTAGGLVEALAVVLGLDACRVEVAERRPALPEEERTRLGTHATRLGVDALAGWDVPALAGLEVTYLVPDAAAYLEEMRPEAGERRRALYVLLLPARFHPDGIRERWRVRHRPAARLGVPALAVLGRACYVGGAPPAHT